MLHLFFFGRRASRTMPSVHSVHGVSINAYCMYCNWFSQRSNFLTFVPFGMNSRKKACNALSVSTRADSQSSSAWSPANSSTRSSYRTVRAWDMQGGSFGKGAKPRKPVAKVATAVRFATQAHIADMSSNTPSKFSYMARSACTERNI